MDATDLATVVVRAHARRSLSPLCRCSPTLDVHDEQAVQWTPAHVADQLHTAGLLITLPAFDLDATGPVRVITPPHSTDPRSTT